MPVSWLHVQSLHSVKIDVEITFNKMLGANLSFILINSDDLIICFVRIYCGSIYILEVLGHSLRGPLFVPLSDPRGNKLTPRIFIWHVLKGIEK